MTKRALWHGFVCLVLTGASLQAGTIVLGAPATSGTANCDPFGCPAFFGLGTYQQVYSSVAFSSTIAIDGISFFQTQVAGNGGQPAGGVYTLSLSYTGDAPGHLSLANANANIDLANQAFFTGALPALTAGSSGNLLSFTGTPFVYDPADGDLLLTVTVTGAQNPANFLYLDQSQCGPRTVCPQDSSVVSSNAYFGSYNGKPVSGGNDIGGLVTEFTYSAIPNSSTPEPGSLLLVAAGIGILWYQRRRPS